jgi:hypothetical protein
MPRAIDFFGLLVMKLSANRIFALLATGLLQLGVASPQPVLKSMLREVSPESVVKIEVLRINPWIAGVVAVRPSGIQDSNADRAIVTKLDSTGVTAIMNALGDSAVLGKRCYSGNYTYESFPVGWAVLLFDAAGHEVGSIFLTESGVCAATPGDVFGIDPSLVIFLRRYFAFMNY